MSDPAPIPPLDLKAETDAVSDELRDAFERVLASGQFVLGPEVEGFERELAESLGRRYAVGLSSGTDALVIGLRALGVTCGDEVVTSAFTFFATAEAISMVGATPVFADIDPATFNLDPEDVAAKITPRTRALLPVHLFGHPLPADRFRAIGEQHGLPVLEDTAQALGAADAGGRAGGWGEAAALSFFPTKNLGALGDAGMLVTDDPRIAEAARMLRVHGSKDKYHNERLGYNARLDALQAALLRARLPHLADDNERRRAVAARYDDALASLPGVTPPPAASEARHVYHQYTVRIAGQRRDAVADAMRAAGVNTACYYPTPIHRLPVYAGTAAANADLPETERAAGEVLSLPIWPRMDPATQDRVIAALARAVAG